MNPNESELKSDAAANTDGQTSDVEISVQKVKSDVYVKWNVIIAGISCFAALISCAGLIRQISIASDQNLIQSSQTEIQKFDQIDKVEDRTQKIGTVKRKAQHLAHLMAGTATQLACWQQKCSDISVKSLLELFGDEKIGDFEKISSVERSEKYRRKKPELAGLFLVDNVFHEQMASYFDPESNALQEIYIFSDQAKLRCQLTPEIHRQLASNIDELAPLILPIRADADESMKEMMTKVLTSYIINTGNTNPDLETITANNLFISIGERTAAFAKSLDEANRLCTEAYAKHEAFSSELNAQFYARLNSSVK